MPFLRDSISNWNFQLNVFSRSWYFADAPFWPLGHISYFFYLVQHPSSTPWKLKLNPISYPEELQIRSFDNLNILSHSWDIVNMSVSFDLVQHILSIHWKFRTDTLARFEMLQTRTHGNQDVYSVFWYSLTVSKKMNKNSSYQLFSGSTYSSRILFLNFWLLWAGFCFLVGHTKGTTMIA